MSTPSALHSDIRAKGFRALHVEMLLNEVDFHATTLVELLSRIQTGMFDGQLHVPLQRHVLRVPASIIVVDKAVNVPCVRDGIPFMVDVELIEKRKTMLMGCPGWRVAYFVTRTKEAA